MLPGDEKIPFSRRFLAQFVPHNRERIAYVANMYGTRDATISNYSLPFADRNPDPSPYGSGVQVYALISWKHLLNNSSRLTNYIQGWSHELTENSSAFVWSRVLRIWDLNRWKNLPTFAFSANVQTRPLSSKISDGLKISGAALAIFVGSFSNISYQDMQNLAFGEQRWLAHVPPSPGQSTATAVSGLLDTTMTGAVVSASLNSTLDLSRVTTRIDNAPKPQRINRKLKGNRVVSSTIQRPPAHFSAGSIIRRQSLMAPLSIDKNQSLAFVKPKTSNEAFRVASLFHDSDNSQKAHTAKLPVMVASLVRESEGSILSFSSEDEVQHSPFSAVIRDREPTQGVPKLNSGDHLWADDPLPKASFSKKQQMCLANGIYFESRGEPARGQAAVAQVILNRVRNPSYPNSICAVVYQNKNWRNRCQFSFACDRKRDRISNPRLWKLAQQIAAETTAGRIWLSQVGSSTHYHATYVHPKWARSMKKVGKIGLHIFYRTFGGGWS